MKQSTSCSGSPRDSDLYTFFGDGEIEVAGTLKNFKNLHFEFESLRRRFQDWGTKRRRSASNSNPSPPHRNLLSPSSSQPLSLPPNDKSLNVKVEASSPATPLSFFPSESEEKPKHSQKKSSKKRKIVKYKEKVKELTLRRETTMAAIEKVVIYYREQKAENLLLKAKLQEVRTEYSLSQAAAPQIHPVLHQQPSIVVDQMVQGSSQAREKFECPYPQILHPWLPSGSGSGYGSGEVHYMGPIGLPDLNVVAVAEETFVERKSRFAEARRRRMVGMKEKRRNSFDEMKSLRCR